MKTSIVSFNIRSIYNTKDVINNFIHRAGFVFDKIEAEKPDVIGFQEVTQPHLDLLEKILTDYQIVGHLRNKDYSGEGVFAAIRKDIKEVTASVPVTFHAYGTKEVKIDYIYMINEFADKTTNVAIWDDEANGIYLSDHYPICAELDI